MDNPTTPAISATGLRKSYGRIAGHDLIGEPDAVRELIGVTGQFSAVDNLLTGQEA
jgi:ABC-2 type transport system ATP-binding protein